MSSEEKKKRGVGDWKQFFLLLSKIKIPWLWIAVAFAFNMAYREIMLLMPTTTASLMSGELSGKALWDAVWFYICYGLLACSQMMVTYLVQSITTRNARNRVWSRMLHIRMDYYDTHNPSDLISTLTNDLSSAMVILNTLLISFIPDIYYLVRALQKVSSYHILLMCSVLLLIPIKIAYSIFIGRWQYRTQSGVYQQIGGLTAYLAEGVRHLSLIKAYTNEEQELKQGEKAARELYHANLRVKKLSCVTTALSTLITLLQNFVTILFGVVLLQQGKITIQQWIAFFLYSSTLSGTISSLISNWISIKSLQGVAARTARVMDAPVERRGTASVGADSRETYGGTEIVFEHVAFSYGDKQALRDVSFTVPQGSSTAIIGLCGSGKTTSLSLMEGFYESDAGEVSIGGIRIGDMDLAEHRKRVSYVQQGAGIFGGTLLEALTYGIRRAVSEEEIMEAAKTTGFLEYLEKQPEGLQARVAPDGSSMSGGQKQRLVLTRELLRDADILLMDEPTSALDAVTAKQVKDTVFSAFAGKTMVIVTHDLDLVTNVDQIIVLNRGIVEGCGTYGQLLESCELFRTMVYQQSGAEETVW